jgi:hypothetical protein
MKIKLSLIGLFIAIFFIFSANISLGVSYDIYVDKNYDGDEEGTPDKPYKKIETALKEAGSKGKKIYIKNGTYEEDLTLEKGIELYGQDKNKTIIKNSATGSVVLKNNNILNALTVSGGIYGVIAEGKADILNCLIKSASNTGLQVPPGSAKITVEKTKIFENTKGMYVQTGRNVAINNNEVYKNGGEGVDLRDKISGTIAGNSIYSNEEGGIELLLGSSNLLIKNNSIKKNNSSGIANQFYDIAKKIGKVQIMDNIISQNGEYGITCNTPSGGYPGKNYWENSLSILGNKIENNGSKSIAGRCGVTNAVDPEENQTNQIIESEKAATVENLEQPTVNVENSAIEAERIQRESEIRSEMEAIVLQVNDATLIAQNEAVKIKNRGKIKIFLLGNNLDDIASMENQTQTIRSLAEKIKSFSPEIQFEENKTFANDSILNLESKASEYENLAQQSKDVFSLFGWLFKIFKR